MSDIDLDNPIRQVPIPERHDKWVRLRPFREGMVSADRKVPSRGFTPGVYCSLPAEPGRAGFLVVTRRRRAYLMHGVSDEGRIGCFFNAFSEWVNALSGAVSYGQWKTAVDRQAAVFDAADVIMETLLKGYDSVRVVTFLTSCATAIESTRLGMFPVYVHDRRKFARWLNLAGADCWFDSDGTVGAAYGFDVDAPGVGPEGVLKTLWVVRPLPEDQPMSNFECVGSSLRDSSVDVLSRMGEEQAEQYLGWLAERIGAAAAVEVRFEYRATR